MLLDRNGKFTMWKSKSSRLSYSLVESLPPLSEMQSSCRKCSHLAGRGVPLGRVVLLLMWTKQKVHSLDAEKSFSRPVSFNLSATPDEEFGKTFWLSEGTGVNKQRKKVPTCSLVGTS